MGKLIPILREELELDFAEGGSCCENFKGTLFLFCCKAVKVKGIFLYIEIGVKGCFFTDWCNCPLGCLRNGNKKAYAAAAYYNLVQRFFYYLACK